MSGKMNGRKENSKEKNEELLRKDFEIEESNAMKVLRGKGEAEKNEHESNIPAKKVGWLENFWYHHKWHAGLIAAALIFIVVVVVQIVTKDNPDVHIMYTGPATVLGRDYEELEDAFIDVMGDYNKDGERAIAFSDVTYLNDKQIAERKAAGGNPDEYHNSQMYQRFISQFSTGEYMFCMLDPAIYESMATLKSFIPLTDIFDTVPSSAVGEYGIRLGDTEFYKTHSGIRVLPPDTVLCIRISAHLSAMNDKEKAEYQEMHESLLRDIAEYTKPEEKK